MMAHKPGPAQWFCTTIFVACLIGTPAVLSADEGAPGSRPPAGQMCPDGAHVIGFDAEANIICSKAEAGQATHLPESAEEVNIAVEEGCQENCQSAEAETQVATEAIATQAVPAEPVSASTDTALSITGVKPKSVLYGSSRVTLTVSGTGFNAETIVKFAGSSYSPSVNQAGTQLEVTVPTRDLTMGNYAVTVSNGPGLETTHKRALVIY